MPRFDVVCPSGHVHEIVARWDDRAVPCLDCGAVTERLWQQSGDVIGDECDVIQHNGTREPIRFRSKQAHRRWRAEHGYRVCDAHIGQNGTDKSKFSSSWSAVTAETLAGATAMLERGSKTSDWEGELGITSGEGLVRYMREKGRAEKGHYFSS